MSTKQQISQRQAFATELNRLRPDVTETDRRDAQTQLNLKSAATISAYLNGKGGNNDISAKLIVFFKERIAKRNEVLA